MERWKIYYNCYDSNGNFKGSGIYFKTYKHKSSAIRAARKIYDDTTTGFKYQWGVGTTNPFTL